MLMCHRCKKEVEPVLTPKGKHLRADCPLCKKYIKFVSHVPSDEFVMPFGKYKGVKLTEVAKIDSDYLHWLYGATQKNNLKEKIDEVLSAP